MVYFLYTKYFEVYFMFYVNHSFTNKGEENEVLSIRTNKDVKQRFKVINDMLSSKMGMRLTASQCLALILDNAAMECDNFQFAGLSNNAVVDSFRLLSIKERIFDACLSGRVFSMREWIDLVRNGTADKENLTVYNSLVWVDEAHMHSIDGREYAIGDIVYEYWIDNTHTNVMRVLSSLFSTVSVRVIVEKVDDVSGRLVPTHLCVSDRVDAGDSYTMPLPRSFVKD